MDWFASLFTGSQQRYRSESTHITVLAKLHAVATFSEVLPPFYFENLLQRTSYGKKPKFQNQFAFIGTFKLYTILLTFPLTVAVACVRTMIEARNQMHGWCTFQFSIDGVHWIYGYNTWDEHQVSVSP